MAWVAVGMAAFGALQGMQKEKQQREDNLLQAELMKYGNGGKFNASDANALNGAMQGGVAGLSFLQKGNEAGIFGSQAKPVSAYQTIPVSGGGGQGDPYFTGGIKNFNI